MNPDDRFELILLGFVLLVLGVGIVLSIIGPPWWHDCYLNCT